MAENGRPLVVSVVVADGLVGSFGLGVCAEVFGYDRRAMGLPRFDFALVGEAPGVLRTDTGIPITVEHGLERLARSDIISITAWELFDRVPSPALLDAFRAAHARGAIDRQPLHRGLRPRRGRPARRQADHHALEVRRRAGRPVPRRPGRPLGPLRGQRAGDHRRGDGGRRRHPPAPGAPGVGRRRGERPGPRDGGPAAPGRRAGPVHRRARARLRGRPARRRPGVGRQPPRRGHQRGRPRPPRADEPAQLRPPVQGDDGNHAARRGCWAGGWPRPRRCSRTPTPRSRRSPGWSASAPRPGCASSSPGAAASRRGPTGRPSARPRQPPGRRRCSWTGTGLAGWGATMPLVEAQLGQPA